MPSLDQLITPIRSISVRYINREAYLLYIMPSTVFIVVVLSSISLNYVYDVFKQ